jgi:hypothetical protein
VLVLFKIMHIMNCLCHGLSSKLIVPFSVPDPSCFDKRQYHLAGIRSLNKIVDAPGNDDNVLVPEQVKRPNPWKMMMMMINSHLF